MKFEPHLFSYGNNRMLWWSCLAWTWTGRDADDLNHGRMLRHALHPNGSAVPPHRGTAQESGDIQERSSRSLTTGRNILSPTSREGRLSLGFGIDPVRHEFAAHDTGAMTVTQDAPPRANSWRTSSRNTRDSPPGDRRTSPRCWNRLAGELGTLKRAPLPGPTSKSRRLEPRRCHGKVLGVIVIVWEHLICGT